MSDETWEDIRSELIESARNKVDPIAYILSLREMSIALDNSLTYGYVEIYEKEIFYSLYTDKDDEKKEK